MEDRDIASFIDSIAGVERELRPDEKVRLLDRERDLVFEEETYQRQLSLVDSEGFAAWTEALRARFEREAAKIVVSPTLDPYQAGRAFGKMSVLAEFSADSRKTERKLSAVREELAEIRTKLNQEQRT